MATLEEIFVLRTNPSLLGRFVAAVEVAAAQIVNESAQTPGHAERIEWAKRAILQEQKSQYYASIIMRIALAENTTLQEAGTDATDNDIQFIVNSYVPKLVGTNV